MKSTTIHVTIITMVRTGKISYHVLISDFLHILPVESECVPINARSGLIALPAVKAGF